MAQTLILSAVTGVFVTAFLWIFQPFGSDAYILENRSWMLWGYGGVTFIVLLVNMAAGPLLLPGFFDEAKWNLYRGMGFQFWNILAIGAANLLFATLAGGREIHLADVLKFLLYALAIGFFPLAVSMFSIQSILLKRYVEATRRMNESLLASRSAAGEHDQGQSTVIFSPESGKDRIEIQLRDLLVIKSVDNYVEIYAADKERTKKILLRSSLKRIENDMKGNPLLFKCHRAFLVNVGNISKVVGNSQGYKLCFQGIEFVVPVSRNLSKGLFLRVTRPRAGQILQRNI